MSGAHVVLDRPTAETPRTNAEGFEIVSETLQFKRYVRVADRVVKYPNGTEVKFDVLVSKSASPSLSPSLPPSLPLSPSLSLSLLSLSLSLSLPEPPTLAATPPPTRLRRRVCSQAITS